ncbi:MAG: DUF6206 family protein [Actinomycetota bacterium]
MEESAVRASALEVEELRRLEEMVVEALRAKDDSALNVLGYGEVSVALGWPVDAPRFVCKRTPPFARREFDDYRQLVTEYVARVGESDLAVADTAIVPLDRGDEVVAYLVQPMLPAESLGHNVLRASEPDADHPFLAALATALDVVTPSFSIDAQVTNFSWDGTSLTLVDVGTPFLWDADGRLRFDMKPFSRMLPAPIRPLAIRELTKLVTRWNDPRTVGVDIVANLYREGIAEWVDPVVTALNANAGWAEPITVDEARALYEEDVKIWPLLKRLQAVERRWQTTVRRRPYDWFIYSSYNN